MDVISFLRPESSSALSKREKALESSGALKSEFNLSSKKKERKGISVNGSYSFAAADLSAGSIFAMPQSLLEPQRASRGERYGNSFAQARQKKPSLEYAAAANSFSAIGAAGAFSGFEAFAFDRQDEEPFRDDSFPLFGALIPIIMALCVALCAIAPALQARFGYYYIEETISFSDDGAAGAAMNSRLNAHANFFNAKDSSLEVGARDIAEPVTYSSYTVRGGDTVSGIAARFGLDNISTILSVNGIENARRIRSGQRLRIPSMDGVLYKAQDEDSLVSIAARFSAPLEAILDANDLTESKLEAGQELFIPGARLSTYDLRRAMGELFIYPIRGRLTSRYGSRADPFTGAKSFHTGVDLAAPTGTSIKASSDGRVAAAGWQNVYGNYAIITHAGGYQTLYAHMSSLSVKRGQYLTQGDEVGKVGSTGYSTGPHLHFSVYKDGKTINPFSVLD